MPSLPEQIRNYAAAAEAAAAPATRLRSHPSTRPGVARGRLGLLAAGVVLLGGAGVVIFGFGNEGSDVVTSEGGQAADTPHEDPSGSQADCLQPPNSGADPSDASLVSALGDAEGVVVVSAITRVSERSDGEDITHRFFEIVVEEQLYNSAEGSGDTPESLVVRETLVGDVCSVPLELSGTEGQWILLLEYREDDSIPETPWSLGGIGDLGSAGEIAFLAPSSSGWDVELAAEASARQLDALSDLAALVEIVASDLDAEPVPDESTTPGWEQLAPELRPLQPGIAPPGVLAEATEVVLSVSVTPLSEAVANAGYYWAIVAPEVGVLHAVETDISDHHAVIFVPTGHEAALELQVRRETATGALIVDTVAPLVLGTEPTQVLTVDLSQLFDGTAYVGSEGGTAVVGTQ